MVKLQTDLADWFQILFVGVGTQASVLGSDRTPKSERLLITYAYQTLCSFVC